MKLYLIIGGVVAILLILAGAFTWAYRQGESGALSDVREQDNKAAKRSDDDRAKFDLCPAGQWDYGAKRCKK